MYNRYIAVTAVVLNTFKRLLNVRQRALENLREAAVTTEQRTSDA